MPSQEFRDTFNYYFKNNNTTPTQATFKIAKPDILKKNLNKKKIRCQKFYINNTALPCFIPDRQVDTSYFNVTTDAVTTTLVNNTLTSNSLKYYIILRDVGNTEAVVVFLNQQQINFGTTAPAYPIKDDVEYYQNRYYHYFDFTHFLSIIKQAIDTAHANHSSYPANSLAPILWMNSNTFQLYISNESQWYLEFSSSLINLFPFKNVQIADDIYRLVFESTQVTINSVLYNEVDANFYSTIYPFIQILFISQDANINPISFIDDSAFKSNIQTAVFEKSILTYDIATNLFNQTYNYYKYVNENDSIWNNFYSQETQDGTNFTITLYLRLQNNILIPYLLNPSELCTFSLEIKYEDQ